MIINTKCIPYIQNSQLRFPKLSNVYPKHIINKNDKFSLVISESNLHDQNKDSLTHKIKHLPVWFSFNLDSVKTLNIIFFLKLFFICTFNFLEFVIIE